MRAKHNPHDGDRAIGSNGGEPPRARERVESLDDRYRTLFDNTSVAITVADENENIISWNGFAEALLGMDQDDLYMKPVKSLYTAAEWKKIRSMDIRRKGMQHHLKTKVVRKSQEIVDVDLSVNVLKGPDGRVTGSIAILADIGEREYARERFQVIEANYRTLFENTFVAITLADENEQIISWNKHAEVLLGMDRDDLHMKPVKSLYPDVEWKKIRSMDIRRKGMQHHLETRMVRKNQEVIDVDLSVSILRGPEGKVAGSIGVMVDVTVQKRADDALRESEERFRELAYLLPLNVFEYDMQGNITYANSIGFEMFGYTQSDIDQGVNVAQVIVPEDVPRMLENVDIVFRGEDPGNPEYMAVRKDGTTFPILTSGSAIVRDGQIVGLRGFSVDITERKQTEDALAESEKQYSTLVSNVADAVFRFSNGVLTWGNDRIWEMLGYEKDEMIGIDVSSFLSEQGNVKQLYSEVRTGLKERGRFHGTTRAKRKDGSTIEIEYSASPVSGKEPLELVGVARDVTHLRQMEQQLLLSGRLAAVGQLSAGVAHELNNPLAAIQGYAQFLTQSKDLDESVRQDVETIYKEAQRASKITDNLLQFSRKHEPEKKLISINEVVEDSLELNAYCMRVNNIEVSTRLAPQLPKTMADFHQMQQVFVNLINNAEHAMAKANGQGTFTVTSELVQGAIRVTFTDDGPGIPKDTLHNIFDPFFTTKEVGEGTGLGLSICFGIIEQHGGTIRADSKVGEGTTLTVELPVIALDEALAKQADSISTKKV